jgi:glutathione S-transferase
MSSGLVLFVGNKNLSSWSLRPYVALAHVGVPFETVVVRLDRPDTRERLLAVSPSGRVPVLRDGEILVWDSLAICEHLADRFPEAKLWPADVAERAHARSVSAEMHSGFADLRREMPMNIMLRERREPSAEVARDVARIEAIWAECREYYGAGGRYLFGEFSIADAMFAPVVTRFETYGVKVSDVSRSYMEAMLEHPAMRKWAADAAEEVKGAA